MSSRSNTFKLLSLAIENIDPGNLGGTANEYSTTVNEIMRVLMEQHRAPTQDEILSILKNTVGDFATATDDELAELESLCLNLIEETEE